jgi:hypothetical protein
MARPRNDVAVAYVRALRPGVEPVAERWAKFLRPDMRRMILLMALAVTTMARGHGER